MERIRSAELGGPSVHRNENKNVSIEITVLRERPPIDDFDIEMERDVFPFSGNDRFHFVGDRYTRLVTRYGYSV